jgi:hypothetical protein
MLGKKVLTLESPYLLIGATLIPTGAFAAPIIYANAIAIPGQFPHGTQYFGEYDRKYF